MESIGNVPPNPRHDGTHSQTHEKGLLNDRTVAYMQHMLTENRQETPDYRKARAKAAEVLRVQHIVRPPIVPREIAESYGLRVDVIDLPADLQNVAGFIDFSENQILVNSADHYNRQTFTIAHELGHFLMHRELFAAHPETYKVLLRLPVDSQSDPLEKEANAFAADLLVPLEMLRLYRKYATEDDLARLFAVSPEVIRYRIKFAGTPVSI